VSDGVASLRHQIAGAGELATVVRTMKAMAASSIGQYENAVRSLDEYARTVQLGLAASLRPLDTTALLAPASGREAPVGAVVFGSDQGLVGRFNEVLLCYVVETLGTPPGGAVVWAVGERIQARLADAGLAAGAPFALPNGIAAITALVGRVLIALEQRRDAGEIGTVWLFHNQPQPGALYRPVGQRLLPLDTAWRQQWAQAPWPTGNLPELMNGPARTLPAFVREYLFISLFRACAESLASENASRLAAMQRAEKNIGELLDVLKRRFHRLRQSGIDAELFDVVAGFEALADERGRGETKP